jgi:hypothetical protein
MRLTAAALVCLLFLTLAYPYYLAQSRDQLLDYYYANVDDKIPRSARMLIGDERINIYIGGQPIGIETRSGQLYSFEMSPIDRPGVIITVSDQGAWRISNRQEGIMQAIDNGDMQIQTTNLFSALKVEVLKRIYAISGIDDQLLGKKKGTTMWESLTSGSIFTVRTARISD